LNSTNDNVRKEPHREASLLCGSKRELKTSDLLNAPEWHLDKGVNPGGALAGASSELLLVVLVVRLGLPLDPSPGRTGRATGFHVVDNAGALNVPVGLDGQAEIRRLDRVAVAGPVERPALDVELEHPDDIGVLVRSEEPLSARVELEVARRHAARVEDPDGRQETRHPAVLLDAKHGNGVMAAIRHEHEAP